MKKILSAALLLSALCASLSAQTTAALRQYVRTLSQTEPLGSSVWGVLAVRMNGDTLVAYNHRQKMVPASNTKLITTGTALHLLGADYRFHTAVAYSGAVEDSTLVGDVYIIGGGDPTLGAPSDCAIPTDKVFAQWHKVLTDAGIREVTGRIVGDPRRMEPYGENTSWNVDDLGWYYGAGVSALNFYENRQDFYTTPGVVVGDPVQTEVIYPRTPWMRYSHTGITAPAGTGDNLTYTNSEFVPAGEIRGTLALDKGRRKQECTNRFPALTCAYYFSSYLADHGMATGGFAYVAPSGEIVSDPAELWAVPAVDIESAFAMRQTAVCQDSLTVIGNVASPSLAEIAKDCLYESDNFYAEAFLKAIGMEMCEDACYDSSLVAEREIIEKQLCVTFDTRAQIVDGSGLSRKNYISPEFFVRFLRAMMKSPAYDTFLHDLPQPGKGTLDGRLTKASAGLQSRVYMKSGSMNGVRCYSGYILPASGKPEDTIVFSAMANTFTVPTSRISRIMDRLITLIGGEQEQQ